jgi:hypothetical protein
VTPSPEAEKTAALEVESERAKVLIAALAAMLLLGLAAYACAVFYPRAVPTVNLIAVLVGVFFLFAALTPGAYRSRALSIAIFLGLLGTFRLMSRFESAA